MVREGSAQPASPTILAGTPATVLLSGTECSTTEPAATREHRPISILPRILAPAPISTPGLIFGWRSPRSLPVPPKVTSCSMETIVADHGSGADDKTSRVIEENAFADPGCRMNIGLEYLG